MVRELHVDPRATVVRGPELVLAPDLPRLPLQLRTEPQELSKLRGSDLKEDQVIRTWSASSELFPGEAVELPSERQTCSEALLLKGAHLCSPNGTRHRPGKVDRDPVGMRHASDLYTRVVRTLMSTHWPTPKLHALANSPGILAVLASSDLGENFDLCSISDAGQGQGTETRWRSIAKAAIVLTHELGEPVWVGNSGGVSMRVLLHANHLALVVFAESGHIAGRSLSRTMERLFNVVI